MVTKLITKCSDISNGNIAIPADCRYGYDKLACWTINIYYNLKNNTLAFYFCIHVSL